jgi:hypothetical protein
MNCPIMEQFREVEVVVIESVRDSFFLNLPVGLDFSRIR